MVGSGVEIGGKTRTVFAARVAGMDGVRGARSARMLPETATLIPMETQTPEGVCSGAMSAGWKLQPNPPTDNLSQFVLPGQLGFEQSQNRLCGQLAVGVVGSEGTGF
jgi:hypothetical protein